MTELQVDDMLRHAMTAMGGRPAFCVVATGSNSAEPHHGSDETVIADGDVVILDFGCDVGGYKSDITRTIAVGSADNATKDVYRIVYEAHMAARSVAQLGATGEQVDQGARKVIEAAGYGPQFFHRTGHGLGQQLHEEPNMVAGNTDLLEIGNVFSIEPGIYIPGQFGVRIENIVAITADGGKSLNEEPSPTLIEIV